MRELFADAKEFEIACQHAIGCFNIAAEAAEFLLIDAEQFGSIAAGPKQVRIRSRSQMACPGEFCRLPIAGRHRLLHFLQFYPV
jgi:hypothetical protein